MKTSQGLRLVAPDGGWGWAVLFAAVLVNVLIPGTIKSFGVLYVEFIRVFDVSPTEASWVPALCYFLYSSLGNFFLQYLASLFRNTGKDLCRIWIFNLLIWVQNNTPIFFLFVITNQKFAHVRQFTREFNCFFDHVTAGHKNSNL